MTTANKHFVRSDTLEDSAPALASVTPFPRADAAAADAGSGAQVAPPVSRGWQMKALIAENRAKVVLAEAEVPRAMADAYRQGNLRAIS